MAAGEVLHTSDDTAPPAESAACDVTVIVPTYAEGANLPLLIPRIAAALDRAELRGEIVIVDDDSPDDTVPLCKELAHDYRLRLFVRHGERGLASAVLFGMRQARGEVLVVMDADLSHPPEKIAELVEAVHSGEADFAVGSRYVAGGSTDAGWGLWRWLNSWAATLLARPLTRVRDPLAGFFALRRATFAASADLDPLGFKIGLELLVKCGCRRVKEVPIAFHDRQHGRSKMSLKEQVNYLRHLRRLYAYRLGARRRRSL
jgi:dolichol-phosphate mannosyltransferase